MICRDWSACDIGDEVGVGEDIQSTERSTYQGRVLEIGSVRQILKSPLHPYTRGLLAAIPALAKKGHRLATISSVVGDEDIDTAYPLTRLKDGRQVSLSPQALERITNG